LELHFRASYAAFGDRVSAMATYNFSGLDTKGSGKRNRGGPLSGLPFPPGLSALSDTPTLVTLEPNLALVDGDPWQAPASTSLLLLGKMSYREHRRRFHCPLRCNVIFLWSKISCRPAWRTYFSGISILATTTCTGLFLRRFLMRPFGDFDNRFEINIPTVSSRYLKVVTKA